MPNPMIGVPIAFKYFTSYHNFLRQTTKMIYTKLPTFIKIKRTINIAILSYITIGSL